MKSIILSIALLFSFNLASAADGSQSDHADLGKEFCTEQAESYVKVFNDKHLKEIGPIQGYSEDISFEYSQDIVAMDNRLETYEFFVNGNNDEGDWWVSKYVVVMDAWLNAGGTASYCDLQNFKYEGVVEHGEYGEENE